MCSPYLNDNISYFQSKLPGVRHIIVQEDLSMNQGGCILETDLGYIDSSVNTKMDLITKAIMAVHKQA